MSVDTQVLGLSPDPLSHKLRRWDQQSVVQGFQEILFVLLLENYQPKLTVVVEYLKGHGREDKQT